VLLVGEILIHRYEHIELFICSAKHLPVAQPCSPLLWYCHNFEI
jgi:hypothetical protein